MRTHGVPAGGPIAHRAMPWPCGHARARACKKQEGGQLEVPFFLFFVTSLPSILVTMLIGPSFFGTSLPSLATPTGIDRTAP